MTCAEARAAIENQIEVDGRRAKVTELSPFERQERALRKGAQLVSNDRGPSLDRPSLYGKMVG